MISRLHTLLTEGLGLQLLSPAKELAEFAPYSAGRLKARNQQTLTTLHSLFPALEALIGSSNVKGLQGQPKFTGFDEISKRKSPKSDELGAMLSRFGSDKSTKHTYHLTYATLFRDPRQVSGVLEVGLGSSRTDVLSNMGASHKGTGGSLRAFREFFPNAWIHGADIDRLSLFQDDRISTYFVDQTSSESLEELRDQVSKPVDFIIDDGLHSPDANLNVLAMGLGFLNPGGAIVIEDVSPGLLSFWRFVGTILIGAGYKVEIEQHKHALLVIVKNK